MDANAEQGSTNRMEWVHQVGGHMLSLTEKVALGSLLTWSNPIDLVVATVAQHTFNMLGTMGVFLLAIKLKLRPIPAIVLSAVNLGLSFYIGRAIGLLVGFQPSIIGIAVGEIARIAIHLAINLYRASKVSQEDPFKTAEKVVTVTKDNFQQEVKASQLPVVLDVYATWCPPCKRMAPIFMQLAEEMARQVKFAKMNVNEQPELAKELNIEVMPTFIFFKDGQESHRVRGTMNREEFLEQIARFKEPVASVA